jgi:polysaccharide pyruvyl transferase WcaK-like protein
MITTQFKTLGFSVLSGYASLASIGRPKGNNDSLYSALILPSTPYPGSLGDEAMLIGSMEYLRKHGFTKIGIVALGTGRTWAGLKEADEVVKVEKLTDYLAFTQAVQQYSHFFALGADVMDGFYSDATTLGLLKLTTLAAKTGAEATILGFSFNEHPTPKSIQAIADLPLGVRLCARDELSYQRLTQQVQRPVELVADVAFLLQPTPNTPLVTEVSQWVRQQKAQDRLVIGMNVNNLFSKFDKTLKTAGLVQVYVNAIAELAQMHPNLSFLMMPHDDRKDQSDVALAANVLEALPEEIRAHAHQVTFPCRAAEIKAICAEVDLVFTGRMHLAIASIGQTTPIACLTYQGKFEGLFRHLELNGVCIAPEKASRPGELSRFINDVLAQRHDVQQQIQTALPRVKQLATTNFNLKVAALSKA